MRRATLILAVIPLATATLGLPGTGHAVEPSCDSGLVRDFNGDNSDDVVVGDPNATVAGQSLAGYVYVYYGPFGTGDRVVLTQDSSGVADIAQAGDRFGAATTTGFIDGDGCADLVVSAPGEDLAGVDSAGAVSVIFGSPAGLGHGRPGITLTQGTGIIPGTRASGDRFGTSVATAAQSPQLLAIGAPNDNVGAANDAGTVTVVRFDANGGPTAAPLLSQNSAGVDDTAESGDRFGTAIGLMGTTLVAGVPGEDLGSATNAGSVHSIRAADTAGPYVDDLLTQNTSGIADSPEAGDEFGGSLYVFKNNLSGVYNLAVAAPGEDVGSVTDAGVIYWLLHNSESTWIGTRFSQNSPGVSDMAERGDRFGSRLLAETLHTPSGFQNLIFVGTPSENVGSAVDAGLVQVLYPSGETLLTLSQSTSGFAGSPASGDHFGASLGSTVDTQATLIVGAPDDAGYPRGVVHGVRWSRLLGFGGNSYTLTPGTNGRTFGASVTTS